MTTRLAGAPELFRLAWRRDRILVPASVLGLVALSVGSAQATLALYPDDEAAATGRRSPGWARSFGSASLVSRTA